MARIKVDLPDPEAPIKATISPASMLNEMPRSTGVPARNDFSMPITSMAALANLLSPDCRRPLAPAHLAMRRDKQATP